MHSVPDTELRPADTDWEHAAATWRRARATRTGGKAEARFTALARTAGGAEFLRTLAAEIVGLDTPAGAARAAARLSAAIEHGELDAAVPRWDRVQLALAAGLAPLAPPPASWLARRVAWRKFAHLIVETGRLDRVLDELDDAGGIRPVVAPVMGRAIGRRQADLQLAEVERLIRDHGAERVAFSLAAVTRLGAGGVGSAARERLIEQTIARLGALARLARATETELVVEVERRCDLSLTIATVLGLLDDPDNRDLAFALSLPVEFNDSFSVLPQLASWAQGRRARGGAPLTLRFTHSDELDAERACAERNAWPLRAHTEPAVAFANLRRMLDWLLEPDRLGGLRVLVASDRAHDHAYAWRLARQRRVLRSVDHELRFGVAAGMAESMKRVVGGIRLRVPVVSGHGLERAAGYLERRVRDEAAGDEEVRDAAVTPELGSPIRGPRRVAVADPCSPEGREWFDAVAARARDPLPPPVAEFTGDASVVVTEAVRAAGSWSQRRGVTRATVLRAVAEALAHDRTELVLSAMAESGLTAVDADAEVTEAIALVLGAAESAEKIAQVSHARFEPVSLVLALASRSSPIAGPTAQVAGALAAGSAVALKPAPENRGSVARLVATIRQAGVPEGLVALIDADESGPVRQLLGDERVERVTHQGSRHIVKALRRDFPDARVASTTGGRNSIIVSESADVDRAVADIIDSAFRGAGQPASSVGTIIVVGEHERFVSLLTDAVASLTAGDPLDVATEVGALARAASEATLDCLTTLGEAELWLVEPRRLDRDGRLWSPGLVDAGAPGSVRHVTERRAPWLSIVRAETFEDAVRVQNGPGFGLVAGLQSLDPDEIATWLDRVEAGAVVVNAPIGTTGSWRQPIPGWHRSSVGASRAPGGRLFTEQFGHWHPVALEPDESVTLEGVSEPVAALITVAQSFLTFDEFDWVRSAARDDEVLWRSEFGRERDTAHLDGVLAVARYRPVPVTVRLCEDATPTQLVRVLAAALRVHAPVALSSARPLPEPLIRFFRTAETPVAEVVVESETRWLARAHAGDIVTERVRVIGDDRGALHRVLSRHPGVAAITGEVTASGHVELAHLMVEQTVLIAQG